MATTAAETFLFELVSPERLLVSEAVRSVVVPGTEGEFEMLKGHAPFLTTISPGVVRITDEAGQAKRIFVRGGFADVNEKGLTILATEAVPVEQLRADRIAQAIEEAEAHIAGAKDSPGKAEAERQLNHLRQVKSTLAA